MNRTQIGFNQAGRTLVIGEASVNNTIDDINKFNLANGNLNTQNITPRNRHQDYRLNFTSENTVTSVNRSKSPNSRMGSRSRQQQEDLVNRFKD